MDKGVEVLLEKEKIDGEELNALLGMKSASSAD